jgi:hypothetical protein
MLEFAFQSPSPPRLEACAGTPESLPMNRLVDWEVLMRVRRRRIVSCPTTIGRVQSICICVRFFIVMPRKQMPSLLLVSSMGIVNRPGEAPVGVGATSGHG